MYICDGHTHTYYSYDGFESAEQICLAAIARGLDEISVTDHYDIDCDILELYPKYRADEAKKEILEAAGKYSDKIKVTYGIELGQPHYYPNEAREFLKKCDFEYVIGSVHNLRNTPDPAMIKFDIMTEKHINTMFEAMINELFELVKIEGISTVAHITYMHRYVKLAGKDLNLKKYYDIFTHFFKIIIEKGIALELNVSTLHKFGMSMPDTDIMKLYRHCGGELVTVGSDAHKAENIGISVRDGYKILKDIGFEYVTTFRDKKPVQNKIQ